MYNFGFFSSFSLLLYSMKINMVTVKIRKLCFTTANSVLICVRLYYNLCDV